MSALDRLIKAVEMMVVNGKNYSIAHIVDEAKTELEALRKATEWQPIETLDDNVLVDILIRSTRNKEYARRACNAILMKGKWYGMSVAPQPVYGEYVVGWRRVPTLPKD